MRGHELKQFKRFRANSTMVCRALYGARELKLFCAYFPMVCRALYRARELKQLGPNAKAVKTQIAPSWGQKSQGKPCMARKTRMRWYIMIEGFGRGVVRLTCDECFLEPYPPVGFESFREAQAWAREHGWHIGKDADGDWIHICPNCARDLGYAPPDPVPGMTKTPMSEPPKTTWVSYEKEKW